MQGRSWMAALTLASGAVLALGSTGRSDDKAAAGRVKLVFAIAGLGSRGCDIEIRPGHPGCQFRPVTRHLSYEGKAEVVLDDVRTTSADRDCAFAIIVREPGHPPRTFHRGLRLDASQPSAPPTLSCYFSSPSRIAGATEMRSRR
jgi:hypothetical protein